MTATPALIVSGLSSAGMAYAGPPHFTASASGNFTKSNSAIVWSSTEGAGSCEAGASGAAGGISALGFTLLGSFPAWSSFASARICAVFSASEVIVEVLFLGDGRGRRIRSPRGRWFGSWGRRRPADRRFLGSGRGPGIRARGELGLDGRELVLQRVEPLLVLFQCRENARIRHCARVEKKREGCNRLRLYSRDYIQ